MRRGCCAAQRKQAPSPRGSVFTQLSSVVINGPVLFRTRGGFRFVRLSPLEYLLTDAPLSRASSLPQGERCARIHWTTDYPVARELAPAGLRSSSNHSGHGRQQGLSFDIQRSNDWVGNLTGLLQRQPMQGHGGQFQAIPPAHTKAPLAHLGGAEQ